MSTAKIPLVSVVIPAYRCAATLPRAIDSALAQQVDVEVLVIDDGSPEDLTSALCPYTGDSRVIYLRNEENLGAADTRNRGVALARGRYVAFLDADDYWAPEKLRKQLAALEKTDAALCCTGRELLTPAGEHTGRVIGVKARITYRALLKHNSINCSSVLLPTAIAREFPMHHAADSHEDYILWLEILRKYGCAIGIDEPLLYYRLSATGKSGSKLHSAAMTFRVYRHMGFSLPKSILCFSSYALHGAAKYLLSGRRGKR